MRISVVIPTYQRAESLGRCLDALARQQRAADETIVVARDEDAASRELVLARGGGVRLVPVARPGVVAAMNAGIAASAGDVVALTDDDAEPHRDWLERIERAYEQDPALAAAGGRDWVYIRGELWPGEAAEVGTISGYGRVVGNHHLGVGPAREVDVLKGVNLSVRGQLLRELGIDRRLRGVGTEHHWELSLCLALRRRGLRVLYDPQIAVDHHSLPRLEDSRQFSAGEVRDAAHNRTVAVLEYLPPAGRAAYLAWASLVGISPEPGVAQLLRALVRRRGREALGSFCGAQLGVLEGLRTYRRCRRAAPPAQVS
ncbi:MAG TPA: glycosyltransferase family 2 protein [Solirubrobacteraceae bacterium]|nr:glycosyltransferase family 2 protein [Solirubrobacteraceae bacterium]